MKFKLKAAEESLVESLSLNSKPDEKNDNKEMVENEEKHEEISIIEEAVKNDVRVLVEFLGDIPGDFNTTIDIYKLSNGIWEKVQGPFNCKSNSESSLSSVKNLATAILEEIYESVRNQEDKDYESICHRICRDAGVYEINDHTASGPGEATLTVEGKIKSKVHYWKMHLDNGNVAIIQAPNRKKAILRAKLMCRAYKIENCNYHLKPASKEEADYITSMGGLVSEDALKEALASWTPQTDQIESNIFPVAGTPQVPTPQFPVGIKNSQDLTLGVTTEQDQYGESPGYLADTRYTNPNPMSQDPIASATLKSKKGPLKKTKVRVKSKNFGYNRAWPTETEATEGNYETHLGNLNKNSVKISNRGNSMDIIAKIEEKLQQGYSTDELLDFLKREASVKDTELKKVIAAISQAVDGILKEDGVMDSPVIKEAANQLDKFRDNLEQIGESTGSFLSDRAQTHIRNFVHAVNTMVKITSNPHIKNYCLVIVENLNEINEISTLRKLKVENEDSVHHVHSTDHKSKVYDDLKSFVSLSKKVCKDPKLEEKEIYKMFVSQLISHTEKLEKVYEELGEFHNPQGEAVISNLNIIVNNIKTVTEDKTIDETMKQCVDMLELLEMIGHHGELHTKLIKEIAPITPLEYTPITDTHEELDELKKTAAVESDEESFEDMPGCDLVYNESPYTIFEMNKEGASALALASEETQWSTKDSKKAQAILNRENVFVVFKNGTPYAQVSKAYDYIGLGVYRNNITIKPGQDEELETLIKDLGLMDSTAKKYDLGDYIWSKDWNKAAAVEEEKASFDEEAELETVDTDTLLTILPTEMEIEKTFKLELEPEVFDKLKSYVSDSGLASSKQVDDLSTQENILLLNFGTVTGQELVDLTKGIYSLKDTDKVTFGPFEVSDFFIKNNIHIDADMLDEQ